MADEHVLLVLCHLLVLDAAHGPRGLAVEREGGVTERNYRFVSGARQPHSSRRFTRDCSSSGLGGELDE